MRESPVLGVDFGTQSVRAAVYSPGGTLLGQATFAYTTQRPGPNRAEQDPAEWWRGFTHAVPEAMDRAGVEGSSIAAVACDGTSFTGVYCREDGTPLRPAILWMDLRAADEATRVEAATDPVLEYCGRKISPEWLLPKTLWVKDHEPAVYRDAGRVVEGVDWIIHGLCGRWATSTGNAAGKRHWTPDRGWPVALYEELGLPELVDKSPDEVVYVGEPLGYLLPEAASALGLSSRCVVSHGGMDGWTAPIGKDCFSPGCASLTLGTSTVVIAETATPRIIPGAMGPFPEGIRPGLSVYEAGQTSGGSTVGWCLDLLKAREDTAYTALTREAAALGPGAEGLVVFDAWRGNRTPYFDPQARGVICGLTLDHGPAHVYRAVLEGCAFAVRNVFETLERGGQAIETVRACGTGAGNALWVDIIASVTGKPIDVSGEKQATCLGSAVCAAVASGLHPDLETAASAMAPSFTRVTPTHGKQDYEPFFALYLETYRQMRHTMAELGSYEGK